MSAQPSAAWQPPPPPLALAQNEAVRGYHYQVSNRWLDALPLPPAVSATRYFTHTEEGLTWLRAAIHEFMTHELLRLNVADARWLEKACGLTAQQALRVGVRSVPDRVVWLFLAAALRERFAVEDLAQIPALAFDETGQLQFNAPRHGLLVQAACGLRRGFQVYAHATARPRWLSAEGGPRQEAIIHAALRGAGQTAIMVAHTLGALIVAEQHNVSAVAYNGAALHAVGAMLYEAAPDLRAVVLACADYPKRLPDELRAAGLTVTFWEGGDLL
jgi:hypothetical protein